MRITAGDLKGRALAPLKDKTVRPTSSKTREALFNIIGSVEGYNVLDLYAGTGSVGFEAISRGASSVTFVDISGTLLHIIKETAEKWNIGNKVICRKKFTEGKFDLIFADPPFTDSYPDLRKYLQHLNEGGYAIFEMPSRNMPLWANEANKLRNYGESTLAIFQNNI